MKSFLIILSVLVASIHVSDAVNAGCSAAAPQSRIECGWPGVSREKCNTMKCCYNDSVPGVKWCFQKNLNVCRYENPQSRVDCGFPGITPEQCDDRNCCYDENVKGVKFCFKR